MKEWITDAMNLKKKPANWTKNGKMSTKINFPCQSFEVKITVIFSKVIMLRRFRIYYIRCV